MEADDEDETKEVASTDPGAIYYSEKLRLKSWYEVDFDSIYKGKLKRLQWTCDCTAGDNIIAPCSHVGGILYLIVFTLTGYLQQYLRQTEREQRLSNAIMDYEPYKKYHDEIFPRYVCICDTPYNEVKKPKSELVKCDTCNKQYHPECINVDKKEVTKAKRSKWWSCPPCNVDEAALYEWWN